MPDNIRYVTHVDILGMSSLVQRNAEQAWEVLSVLASVRDHLDSFGVEVTASGQKFAISDRVFRVMFSDTIVLFTKGETEDDLRLLLIATGELFHKAMFKGIPVRGGVALGKFFFNFEESMFAGPALIDAYHLGESAQWLGISTSETVYRRSKAANIRSGLLADAVIPAMIPVTKSAQNLYSHKPRTNFIRSFSNFWSRLSPMHWIRRIWHRRMYQTNFIRAGYTLNWPSLYANDFKVEPPISLELFYSQFVSFYGPLEELREADKQKYLNTVAFLNASWESNNHRSSTHPGAG